MDLDTETTANCKERALRDDIVKAVRVTIKESIKEELKTTNESIKALVENAKKIQHQVNSNTAGLIECSKKSDSIAESMKYIMNISISGIPYKPNENLDVIFANLSAQLGFAIPPAARLQRMFNADPNKRPIIATLDSYLSKLKIKENFPKIAKTLTLASVGVYEKPDDRIYISEQLSQFSHKVRATALQLKKAGKLRQVDVENGSVKVQLVKNGKYFLVSSVNALNSLIAINEKKG